MVFSRDYIGNTPDNIKLHAFSLKETCTTAFVIVVTKWKMGNV